MLPSMKFIMKVQPKMKCCNKKSQNPSLRVPDLFDGTQIPALGFGDDAFKSVLQDVSQKLKYSGTGSKKVTCMQTGEKTARLDLPLSTGQGLQMPPKQFSHTMLDGHSLPTQSAGVRFLGS